MTRHSDDKYCLGERAVSRLQPRRESEHLSRVQIHSDIRWLLCRNFDSVANSNSNWAGIQICIWMLPYLTVWGTRSTWPSRPSAWPFCARMRRRRMVVLKQRGMISARPRENGRSLYRDRRFRRRKRGWTRVSPYLQCRGRDHEARRFGRFGASKKIFNSSPPF